MNMVKILIVDDEPNVLLSLELLMKKEGFIVFIARNGEEAFDIIKREHPKRRAFVHFTIFNNKVLSVIPLVSFYN